MSLIMNRRQALAVGVASVASLALPGRADTGIASPIVQAHDEQLKKLLESQTIDSNSRWCGGIPDRYEIYFCTAAAGLLCNGAAAYCHPESRYHASQELLARMKLASDFLTRCQHEDGTIDLPVTNFDSTPDTGFVVHRVAAAGKLAEMNGAEEVLSLVKDFLLRAGSALSTGGIHTPNHRWVVCAALAQINDLFPDKKYIDRIDQWLAEGIDIDAEGQFTECSTATYNSIVDTALVVAAHKLDRPALLDPVRRNLDAMAYLLHPNGEVVTEISHRQDLNTRGTMSGYWFPLRYMAIRDGNGLYASMLKPLEPEYVELARLMEYPEIQSAPPEATPLPNNYEREYELAGITRIRRDKVSATILHKENSRWISLRNGEAVINAVRFASAFFGKGQFIPADYEKRDGVYHFKQALQGWYLQPLADPGLLPVHTDSWSGLVAKRAMSEICRMTYETQIRETPKGFEITISAEGTANVPIAVEINFREGGMLSGVTPAPDGGDAYLLKQDFAEYAMGSDVIRFGPGKCEHAWVQLRGAEPKLPGPSVYLTAYTPLQYTATFEMV